MEYVRLMDKWRCTKNHISFTKVFGKGGSPKKITLEYYIFTVLSGNMESFLPKSTVFLLGRITSQTDQAQFGNLAAFAESFLSVFDHFGILDIKRLKNEK